MPKTSVHGGGTNKDGDDVSVGNPGSASLPKSEPKQRTIETSQELPAHTAVNRSEKVPTASSTASSTGTNVRPTRPIQKT